MGCNGYGLIWLLFWWYDNGYGMVEFMWFMWFMVRVYVGLWFVLMRELGEGSLCQPSVELVGVTRLMGYIAIVSIFRFISVIRN